MANAPRLIRMILYHHLGSADEGLEFLLDHLDIHLKLLEGLRCHLNRGQRAAIVTVACSELTVKLIKFIVNLEVSQRQEELAKCILRTRSVLERKRALRCRVLHMRGCCFIYLLNP